jgi:hypothetical protein
LELEPTKGREDSIPFIERLFIRSRELNKGKIEPLLRSMDKITDAHGKVLVIKNIDIDKKVHYNQTKRYILV